MATARRDESATKKLERYGWETPDQVGSMMWLDKSELSVDTTTYQRDGVTKGRILAIARDWSWVACGVLIVAQRGDGTYWVIDGQHRKLAAEKRPDVTELPCIVFEIIEIETESMGFVRANTVRGPVKSLDKFRALLVAGEQLAVSTNDIVRAAGYVVGDSKGKSVACVNRLMACYSKWPELFEEIFALCVEIYDGAVIPDRSVGGLFRLEVFLRRKKKGTILDAYNRAALVAAGPTGLKASIHKARAYYQKGGEAVWAQGIIDLLNYRRSSRRLPHILS